MPKSGRRPQHQRPTFACVVTASAKGQRQPYCGGLRRPLDLQGRGCLMEIRRAIPHPKFRKIVRLFEERRADLGSLTINWPVSARPHQIIDIYLEEPFRVRLGEGSIRAVPETVVVGPQTFSRARLSMSGKVHVFNILFQPTGLNQLIGVDMRLLVNQDPAASDVLGTSAVRLSDTVRSAKDFFARVRATEQWLDGVMEKRAWSNKEINHASTLLIGSAGQIRVDD